MYKLILFLAVFFTGYFATAQKITKAYGYWCVQMPGNIPVVPEEANERNTPVYDRHESYFVYVESSQAKAPLIKSVSVRGAMFKATAVKQEQLPVEYYTGVDNKKISLVPKGRKNVYVVVLGEYMGAVPYKDGTNDMTIGYTDGNKSRWTVLSKMKQLPERIVP